MRSLRCPVLVGMSRKSMVASWTPPAGGRAHSGSSIAAALAAVARGAHIVRVHDVAQTVAALTVWKAVQDEASPAG